MLNVLYHIEIEMKIRESCLQTGNFIYKPGISLTKQDFHLQRGSLGLQRGFSGYYLPRVLYITYLPSAICQRMNDKKIANCMQFAIKRNIMKKKEEAISMARTANVFARVEPEVKEQAEYIQQVKLKQK